MMEPDPYVAAVLAFATAHGPTILLFVLAAVAFALVLYAWREVSRITPVLVFTGGCAALLLLVLRFAQPGYFKATVSVARMVFTFPSMLEQLLEQLEIAGKAWDHAEL
jgi:hypothetical protein